MDNLEFQFTKQTRAEGYAVAAPKADDIAAVVLATLAGRPSGLTANEIQALNPGVTLNSVRSRLTELKLRGTVRAIGKRINPATGVHVAVWVEVAG